MTLSLEQKIRVNASSKDFCLELWYESARLDKWMLKEWIVSEHSGESGMYLNTAAILVWHLSDDILYYM